MAEGFSRWARAGTAGILPEAAAAAHRSQAPAPALAVVIPVFNGERFLAPTLDSVLSQGFADFELIAVDDGSSDGSAEILAEYSARDPRLKAYRQPNRGASAALNRGIGLAGAPLIARLDADDLALPGRFERQVRFLAENPAVGMVGGQATIVDGEGRRVGPAGYPSSDADIRRAFDATTPFVHSAVTMRKAVFEQAGGYRPAFNKAEDLDLWLRMAEHAEVANLPGDPVVAYRIHVGQVSVQGLQAQAVRSLAARAAARARAAGQPDPFADADEIDEDAVLAQGIGPEEIVATVVEAATWMARTMDRAGLAEEAEELLAVARRRAGSEHGSPALIGSVERSRARRQAERGQHLRARLSRARAAWIER